MKKLIVAMGVSIFLLAGALNAHAVSLVAWNLAGQPGDEVSVAASSSATNVSGLNLTRGTGLTPNTGTNSLNSRSWGNQITDYVQFGLTVSPGYKVTISDLYIGTQSSATGPGTMGLYVSTDNYTTPLMTFNQSPGANLVNSNVTFSTLNDLTDTVYFRLIQIGSTAANGGTTGSSGTFRVTNYFQGSTDTGSFRLTGSVSPVPIPSAVWLFGSGLLGLTGWRRFSKG